jgi:hypothetical protein
MLRRDTPARKRHGEVHRRDSPASFTELHPRGSEARPRTAKLVGVVPRRVGARAIFTRVVLKLARARAKLVGVGPRHIGARASFTRVVLKLARAPAKLVGVGPRHVGARASFIRVVLKLARAPAKLVGVGPRHIGAPTSFTRVVLKLARARDLDRFLLGVQRVQLRGRRAQASFRTPSTASA